MDFSINDYSITPKEKGWGNGFPTDRSSDMRKVTANKSQAHVNVHKRIARLVDMLLDETESRGYVIEPNFTGAYNNRAIAGTNKPSNHSWGLAIDINSNLNPQTKDGQVHSNLPKGIIRLWHRHGFAWGGNYIHSFKDPMHFEFMGSKDDADDMTLRAARKFTPSAARAAHMAPEVLKTYTVRQGDTLFLIARRFNVPGGWKTLLDLNRNVIPDSNIIVPGQVLRLP